MESSASRITIPLEGLFDAILSKMNNTNVRNKFTDVRCGIDFYETLLGNTSKKHWNILL